MVRARRSGPISSSAKTTLALAALLVASDEYFNRAQTR